MRTLITNGTVVNADGSYRADVLIEDDKIVAVGTIGDELARREGRSSALAQVAVDRTIDAKGRWVIPGGIDPHTHMELPFGGTFAKDTFETGTRAAAFGGTTTILDFAVQTKGQSLREGLDTWMAKAEGECAIDYGFHMIMGDVNDDTLKEMDALVDEGVTDFKLFTAYPGRLPLRRRRHLPGHAPDRRERRAHPHARRERRRHRHRRQRQLPRPAGPIPTTTVSRACPSSRVSASTASSASPRRPRCPVYIVHLSSRDALEEVVRGRDRGAMAFAETCPQYLFLSLEDMGNGFEGAKYVCSPPLRPADHQEDLWRGLVKDDLQTVGTDHCPFDFVGQKELGLGDFRKVPNGLPGVEERVDLMFQGVVTGRYTKERWVEITSTAAARIFGLAGRKGIIAPGRRRRHRHLRPRAQARPLRLDASHERRLLLLRRHGGPGRQRYRALARQGRSSRTASTPAPRATAASSSAKSRAST